VTAVMRTVLGDVPAETLGRTDYHEHLFHSSPLLPGDDLDDPARSQRETMALRDSGFDALVDLTPLGMGRNPGALAAISAATGMHVVGATGVHRRAHYPAGHPLYSWTEDDLAEWFVAELVEGYRPDPFSAAGLGPPPGTLPPTSVRAGVLKVGAGYWEITDFERRVFAAAGAAHAATRAAVVCHLELGSAAWEAADLLERAGVSRDRIVLAHADRNPDPELHAELVASGVYLGYDGAGRTKYWPDSVLVDCLVTVANRAGADRLLLGGDVARRSSFEAYGGLPGMSYLGRRFVPRLRAAGGEDLVDAVLVRNPARVLALPSREN
jgi:5-phospho-D-xylono-1,4-lactonase